MTGFPARSMLVVLAMCLLGPAAAAAETKEEVALKAARDWLAIVDAGNYDESWNQAAVYFKSAVGKEQWRQTMAGVRRSLARVVGRELVSRIYTKELPQAPAGEYVVIRFTTAFENKPGAIETVIPMREADGTWAVAGYFIK